jgi:FkbM family methyltransferase
MTYQQRVSLPLVAALAFCLALFMVCLNSKQQPQPQQQHDWLLDVWRARDVPRTWTMYLYEDAVTMRSVLLPSEPAAVRNEPYLVALFNQLHCQAEPLLFVDIGMHSGFYAILARLRGCRVVGVEIQPSCLAMFRLAERANFMADQPTPVIQQPVGATDGERLSLDLNQNCYGMLSLFWKGPAQLQSITLDTLLLHRQERIAMLKIDIEGFEPHAFSGARQLIASRRVDAFLVEATWWPNVFQPLSNAYAALSYVFDHGYTISCIGAGPVAEYKQASEWMAFGSSALASAPLANDPEGRYLSTCSDYLVCITPDCPYTLG